MIPKAITINNKLIYIFIHFGGKERCVLKRFLEQPRFPTCRAPDNDF